MTNTSDIVILMGKSGFGSEEHLNHQIADDELHVYAMH
jgi:hypothetical protein